MDCKYAVNLVVVGVAVAVGSSGLLNRAFGQTKPIPGLRAPLGGAPPAGSGPIEITDFVRAIEADTFEVRIRGNRVGIGVIGVKSPRGNTPCGKEARDFFQKLVLSGIRLEEDRTITFDARKRRMYNVKTRTGASIAQELVRTGNATVENIGSLVKDLLQLELAAKLGKRGCLWGPLGSIGRNDAPLDPPKKDLKGSAEREAASDQQRDAAVQPPAMTLPAGFDSQTIASGLNFPTAFTFLPDGRILVTEKRGVVRVIQNGALLATPLIDLSSRVNDYWDRGLIGIAADPNFNSNGYVYLSHTYENDANNYSGPKTSQLIRITVVGNTASAASIAVILGTNVGNSCNGFPAGADCLPADSPSHSVGNLKFGSDGALYMSQGDGASFNNVDDDALRAQNLDSLAGKVLRINTSGTGIPGNPFWNGVATSNRSKVWAYGLRNPFRLNHQPGSGVVYLGDVGWGSSEEVNQAPAGANLGWPCYEGLVRQGGYEGKPGCQALYAQGQSAVRQPLTSWDHLLISSAVVGGAFYTGTAYPAAYQNAYFYGDYGQNFIRYLKVDGAGSLTTYPTPFSYSADAPVAIETGPDGSLYYLAISVGQLRKIVYNGTAESTPPAVVSITPANGAGAVPVTTAVTVGFSESINTATLTSTTVALVRNDNSAPVSATIAYDPNMKVVTLQPVSALQLNVAYRMRVQGGPSGIKDLAGNPLPSDVTWIFTTFNTPPTGTSYLSNLNWTYMSNAWGPIEKDMSNGETAPGDGRVMNINGTTYAKGLGVHAPSDVRFYLGGTCTTFTAAVGVDAEVGGAGSIIFQVWGDGVKIAESPVMRGSTSAFPLSANVSGKNEIALIATDGGDGASSDHGDWGNAQITCGGSGGDITPPTIISVTPAGNASGVSPSAAVLAGFSEAVNQSTINPGTFTLVHQATGNPVPAPVTYSSSEYIATLRPSQALQGGAEYRAKITGGSSGVKDIAGNALAADRVWTFIVSNVPPTGTSYLSDLNWTFMSNGWGPVEKDKSNGETAAGDGRTININGSTFAKGLGVHAPSDVRYFLGGTCDTFSAAVGVDAEIGGAGSVIFQVWADGVKLAESPLKRGMTATSPMNVNIAGKDELALIVTDGGDGGGSDHADWAMARITCGTTGGDTTPPTIISIAPAANATNVAPTTSVTAGFSEPLNAATINVSTFSLVNDSTGAAVPASVSYNATTFVASLTPTQPLTGNVTYRATVEGGSAGVKDDSGNAMVSNRVWTFTTSNVPPSGTSYLSDLNWSSMSNDWGPAEKNMSNGETAPADGRTININGSTFVKGLGVHAASDLRYFLGGTCSSFSVLVGVDDEVLGSGSVIFQVWADGVKLAESPVMRGSDPAFPLNATLSGKNELALIVTDGGDGGGSDHADWANAQITCGTPGADTTPPTVISTTPLPNATNIPPSIAVTAGFSEAINAATITATTFNLVNQATTVQIAATVSYNSASQTATLTPSQPLQAGQVYRATVLSGPTGVKDAAGNALAEDKIWSFTISTAPGNGTTYMSDLNWTFMGNGWGPAEKDKSNGETRLGDGRTITIAGTTYIKGLGIHSQSQVRYFLGGSCIAFDAIVGVDAEVGTAGSLIFQVWGDGTKLGESPVMRGGAAGYPLHVNISGKNEIALIATDSGDGGSSDHGDWADARVTCGAGNTPPTPTITAPSSSYLFRVGDIIQFQGFATDAQDGNIPSADLTWQILIQHCPSPNDCHSHQLTTATGPSGSFIVPDHGDNTFFKIILTARDSGNLTATKEVAIMPQTVQLTLQTSPPGLQLIYGSEAAQTAPITKTPIVGSSVTITAPSPQGSRTFTSWSDGGAQQHNVLIGTSNATYTATFSNP